MSRIPVSRVAIEIDTSKLQTEAEVAIRALGNALEKLDRKKRVIDTEKFRKNATRKMKTAVLDFAVKVLDIVSNNTPVGNDVRLSIDKNYRRLYEWREEVYGIPATPGFHQGAYVYSEKKNPPFIPEIRDIPQTTSDFIADFNTNYQIGNTFYVAATGPAYRFFQQGLIGNGPVAGPSLDQIMQIYSTRKIGS